MLPVFGRRVVVVDLRGRGRSDALDEGYAFEHHVSDVAAVVADTGIDRFHLCTSSVAIGDYHAREIRTGSPRQRPLRNGSANDAGIGVAQSEAQPVRRGAGESARCGTSWARCARHSS